MFKLWFAINCDFLVFQVLWQLFLIKKKKNCCGNFISHVYLWMQISEAMDIRTRQGLLNALTGKVGKRMDTLLIPLELLCCISRTEFSDKKSYIRWQKRQVCLYLIHFYLLSHFALCSTFDKKSNNRCPKSFIPNFIWNDMSLIKWLIILYKIQVS